MKDPYQISLSSYEILEVSQNATKEDINSAFKKAIAGKNRDKAPAARANLINETDRALEDFLMYDAESIEAYGQKDQFVDLLEHDRSSLVAKYNTIQSEIFPEVGPCTHVLALLWYWKAVNEEERCLLKLSGNALADLSGEISNLENAWGKAIAYFTALLGSSLYVEKWIEKLAYNKSAVNEFTTSFENKVKSKFENNLQNNQDKFSTSNKILSQAFTRLLDNYRLETSCANKLRTLGIEIGTKRKGSVKVEGIGKNFIEEHGSTDAFRKALSGLSGSKKNIANELILLFSPYSHLLEKINKKQYQAVLAEIEKLTKTEKSDPEIIYLTGEALKGLLRYTVQNKNIDDLLKYSKKYFTATSPIIKEIIKTLADDIDVMTRDHMDARPDDVIIILKSVHKIYPEHANIKLRLAGILLDQGIKKYLEGEKKYEVNPSDDNILEMEIGFEEVEESYKLNPSERAREQHDIIKQNIELYNSNKRFPHQPKPKPADFGAISINNEGIEILKGCDSDYEKYIKTKTLIKELEEIKKTQGLNDKGTKMLYDSLIVIATLNDNLYDEINNAINKFTSALKIEPSNEIFRKNKELAEKMLSELKKPKTIKSSGKKKSSSVWYKPIVRVVLYLALAFLAYLLIWEFKVNNSLF
jgi:hypothetical protein